jgi:hypothetical protein
MMFPGTDLLVRLKSSENLANISVILNGRYSEDSASNGEKCELEFHDGKSTDHNDEYRKVT